MPKHDQTAVVTAAPPPTQPDAAIIRVLRQWLTPRVAMDPGEAAAGLLKALAQAGYAVRPAGDGWQPIDTAPYGQEIIVCVQFQNGDWHVMPDERLPIGGWMISDDDALPMFWMPLPPPPQTGASGEVHHG